MIEPDKLRLQLMEEQLYYFNSKVVSLHWIGLKEVPSQADIRILNELLGRAIKLLREIREND